MLDWLNEVAGPGYAQAVLWTGLALLLLLVVLIAVKLVRSMTFGTFVAGGRNRKTRLAVMDATAVDSQRRLVLIRRDDVEHLLLIGGPSDVVVERDIRPGVLRRQPNLPEALPVPPPTVAGPAPIAPAQAAAPRARLPEPPRQTPAPAPRPVAERSLVEQARGDSVRRTEPTVPERPAPRSDLPRVASAPSVQSSYPSPAAVSSRTQPRNPVPVTRSSPPVATSSTPSSRTSGPADDDDLDDELLKELAVSLDDTAITPKKPTGSSLDEEMSKLLGELSNPRR